jgi:uncharacterized membrane protein (UPF0127 family)
VWTIVLLVGVAAALVGFAGVGGSIVDLKPARRDAVRVTVNGVPLTVEVADSVQERSLGLMFRDTLPDDSGMLFLWTKDTDTGFWMANTYIPLSIAFLAEDGTILDIVDRPDTRSTMVTTPATRYRAALEVPLGWFTDHDIEVGGRVLFP